MDFFYTHISPKAKELVNQVLDSGFLNQGPMVERFEIELEKRGLSNPLTVNSCTSGLQLALECIGVRGKDVIIPSQGFIATGLSVLAAGGNPVFCDITKSGHIDVDNLIITDNTKALICVDWGGIPCNMDRLRNCLPKNCSIVVDAAHSFGAKYKNDIVGSQDSVADFTVFSFQSIKGLTTGDGGAICCKHKYHYEKLRSMRWFGIDKKSMTRNYDGSRNINVGNMGYKAHMNDLSAAMGIGNLIDFDLRFDRRSQIADFYNKNIKWSNNNINQYIPEYEYKSSNWLYTIIVKNKPSFVNHMSNNKIPVMLPDRGIHKNPVFVKNPFKPWILPGQEYFDEYAICLPIHEKLTDQDIDEVIDACNSWRI